MTWSVILLSYLLLKIFSASYIVIYGKTLSRVSGEGRSSRTQGAEGTALLVAWGDEVILKTFLVCFWNLSCCPAHVGSSSNLGAELTDVFT